MQRPFFDESSPYMAAFAVPCLLWGRVPHSPSCMGFQVKSFPKDDSVFLGTPVMLSEVAPDRPLGHHYTGQQFPLVALCL